MSGKHSEPDKWGRKTDAAGDVISISGTLEEPSRDRVYKDAPQK